MKSWKLTIIMETEAEDENKAIVNIQNELFKYSDKLPWEIGEWKEIMRGREKQNE